MNIDVVMIFDTMIQQTNWYHYIKNSIRVGTPFDINVFLESYIGKDMMRVISELSGIPLVDENEGNRPFLDYMNSNSCYPLTYKIGRAHV